MCMKCVLNGVVRSYMRKCPHCQIILNLVAKCERLAGANEYARMLAQNITDYDRYPRMLAHLGDQMLQLRCYRQRLQHYLDELLPASDTEQKDEIAMPPRQQYLKY